MRRGWLFIFWEKLHNNNLVWSYDIVGMFWATLSNDISLNENHVDVKK